MSQSSDTMRIHSFGAGLLDRIVVSAAWGLGVALFLTIGWTAMSPDDPRGPISLLAKGNGLFMLAQAAALAAVATALATVIAGSRLPEIGTFAGALGLCVVTLRGATAEYLLVHGADTSESFERMLAIKFTAESFAWILVVLLLIAVATWVSHWCHRSGAEQALQLADDRGAPPPILAGTDFILMRRARYSQESSDGTSLSVGIRYTIMAAGVGLATMAILSAGLTLRMIQHGQVCFVVAASVFAGTFFAFRSAPVCSALWSILAVGCMAIVAYVWAALRPTITGLPPNIPSSHFLRILPIQFIAVGTASAVASFWYVFTSAAHHDTSGHPPKREKNPARKS